MRASRPAAPASLRGHPTGHPTGWNSVTIAAALAAALLLPTIAGAQAPTAVVAAPLVAHVPVLTQAGAEHALRDAERRAGAAKAPSAIAVVDGEGLLLAFTRMDDVRPGSIDLAIGKARSAALMRRPTRELEANVAKGRVALATAGLTALRGGAPIMVGGVCVGAVGVAGLNKDQDDAIATAVAVAMGQAS